MTFARQSIVVLLLVNIFFKQAAYANIVPLAYGRFLDNNGYDVFSDVVSHNNFGSSFVEVSNENLHEIDTKQQKLSSLKLRKRQLSDSKLLHIELRVEDGRTLSCRNLLPIEEYCPLARSLKVSVHKKVNGNIQRSDDTITYSCQSFATRDYSCVLTKTEQGLKVMKYRTSGSLVSFTIVSCGEENSTDSCVIVEEPSNPLLSLDDDMLSPDSLNSSSSTNRRKLQGSENKYVNLWTGCYEPMSAVNEFYVGYLIGSHFANSLNNNVDAILKTVEALVADANIIYTQQLSMKLTVRHIEIVTAEAEGATKWDNVGCVKTIQNQLSDAANSNHLRLSQQGLWQILEDCYNGNGVVGLAFRSDTDFLNFCTDHKYSLVYKYPFRQWQIVAHEFGHSFGAGHSFEEGVGKTGGIMDGGVMLLNNEYQFNEKYRRTEICRQVNLGINECPEMFNFGAKSVCGNNEVEGGEECECENGALSCFCCENCKLKSGKQCDGVHNECCSSDCKWFPGSQQCTHSEGPGYCRRGVCTNLDCNFFLSETYCGTSETNPCFGRCTSSGVCSNNIFKNPERTVTYNFLRDGALCSTSSVSSGECLTGVCTQLVASQPIPNPVERPTSSPTTPTTVSTPGSSQSPTPNDIITVKSIQRSGGQKAGIAFAVIISLSVFVGLFVYKRQKNNLAAATLPQNRRRSSATGRRNSVEQRKASDNNTYNKPRQTSAVLKAQHKNTKPSEFVLRKTVSVVNPRHSTKRGNEAAKIQIYDNGTNGTKNPLNSENEKNKQKSSTGRTDRNSLRSGLSRASESVAEYVKRQSVNSNLTEKVLWESKH